MRYTLKRPESRIVGNVLFVLVSTVTLPLVLLLTLPLWIGDAARWIARRYEDFILGPVQRHVEWMRNWGDALPSSALRETKRGSWPWFVLAIVAVPVLAWSLSVSRTWVGIAGIAMNAGIALIEGRRLWKRYHPALAEEAWPHN